MHPCLHKNTTSSSLRRRPWNGLMRPLSPQEHTGHTSSDQVQQQDFRDEAAANQAQAMVLESEDVTIGGAGEIGSNSAEDDSSFPSGFKKRLDQILLDDLVCCKEEPEPYKALHRHDDLRYAIIFDISACGAEAHRDSKWMPLRRLAAMLLFVFSVRPCSMSSAMVLSVEGSVQLLFIVGTVL